MTWQVETLDGGWIWNFNAEKPSESFLENILPNVKFEVLPGLAIKVRDPLFGEAVLFPMWKDEDGLRKIVAWQGWVKFKGLRVELFVKNRNVF